MCRLSAFTVRSVRGSTHLPRLSPATRIPEAFAFRVPPVPLPRDVRFFFSPPPHTLKMSFFPHRPALVLKISHELFVRSESFFRKVYHFNDSIFSLRKGKCFLKVKTGRNHPPLTRFCGSGALRYASPSGRAMDVTLKAPLSLARFREGNFRRASTISVIDHRGKCPGRSGEF